MSDVTTSATVPASTDTSTLPAATAKPRGYFNQSQLDEIDLAESIHRAALGEPYAARLATRDLDAAWLGSFGAAIAEAREKSRLAGESRDTSKAATANAAGTGRTLLRLLQAIQGAAKQKNRMLAEDDDPATAFPLDGYLIGRRLDDSRGELLQNAETLIAKAAQDQLPGYTTEADLAPLRAALASYRLAEGGQSMAGEAAASERVARDRLVRKIQVRRQAVQHAIDGLYPYYEAANAPVRRRFELAAGRPFGG